MGKTKFCFLVIGVSVLTAIQFAPGIFAVATQSKGYQAVSELPIGAIVSVTESDSSKVEKTTIENDKFLAGVVIGAEGSLVDVLPSGSQVLVGTEGEVDILVSTMNGDIKPGDRLIASPLSGIAALDYPPAPGVVFIGYANQEFTSATEGATIVPVNLSNGSTKDVSVGVISAKLQVGNRNPDSSSANFLTKLGTQISGKDVSLLQVLAATLIFVTAAILCGVILFSSIRGTFVSLGRNPLSRDSLLVGLARVLVLAVLILSAGAGVAYFVLTL